MSITKCRTYVAEAGGGGGRPLSPTLIACTSAVSAIWPGKFTFRTTALA
jgi:hypothetical protein